MVFPSLSTRKRFEKSTLPSNSPIGGISTSETSDPMIAPNAAPIMIPTAMSITFPFTANFLNSSSMEGLLFRKTMFNAQDRGTWHATLAFFLDHPLECRNLSFDVTPRSRFQMTDSCIPMDDRGRTQG